MIETFFLLGYSTEFYVAAAASTKVYGDLLQLLLMIEVEV